jgi:hypothetical protein
MNKWTILIIMAIVAPVFFLGGCSITGKTSEVFTDNIVGCSLNTEIDFLRINGAAQACYRENSLYFVVDNKGINTVTGLSVYLESDYNITMLVRESIGPGESLSQDINFGNQGLRGMRSLTVYPLIGDAQGIVCSNIGITTDIEEC